LPKNKLDSIQFILSVSKDDTISQSNTSLILNTSHDAASITSNTDAKRIKHGLLSHSLGLFLSSAYTPGLNSELIQKGSDSKLIKPSHLQFVPAQGCFESGLISDDETDKILFTCPDSKKLLQINI